MNSSGRRNRNRPSYEPPAQEDTSVPPPFTFGGNQQSTSGYQSHSPYVSPPQQQQQPAVSPPQQQQPKPTYYYQNPEGKPVPIRRDTPLSDPERNNGGGRMESEEERKRNLLVRILRIIFLVFQGLCFLAGIALVILGAYAFREAQKRHLSDTQFVALPVVAVALGAVLMIVALIGFMGAMKRSKFTAVLYCVLVLGLIGGEIYALVKSRRLLSNLQSNMSDWWSEMREESRIAFQDWRKCCGFEGEGDRDVQPCPVDAVGGCAEPMIQTIKKWSGTILKVFITMVVVECVLIVSALLISYIF